MRNAFWQHDDSPDAAAPAEAAPVWRPRVIAMVIGSVFSVAFWIMLACWLWAKVSR